jgi:hypothetical protein
MVDTQMTTDIKVILIPKAYHKVEISYADDFLTLLWVNCVISNILSYCAFESGKMLKGSKSKNSTDSKSSS